MCISSRYKQRGIIAEVEEIASHKNDFLITFLDVSTARKVHANKEEYEFCRVRVNFPPRAGPRKHVKYVVLFDSELYNGKSPKSSCIGELNKGAIVTANQFKNRRVRLMDGKRIMGWVNLFTKNNEERLLRIA